MPTMAEMLPFLDGWRYQYESISGTLTIGQQKIVYDTGSESVHMGYFLEASAYVTGSLDGKYTSYSLIIDGPSRPFPVEGASVYGKMMNAVLPPSVTPFLTTYSNAQKLYAMKWNPGILLGFKTRIQAILSPPKRPIEEPTALPINYVGYVAIIMIEDKEAFLKSYAEAMKEMGMAPSVTEVVEKKVGEEEKIVENINKTKVVLNPPPLFPKIGDNK